MCQDSLVVANQSRIIGWALAARLPAIYTAPDWVENGGLMAYGANERDLFAALPTTLTKFSRNKARRYPRRAADQIPVGRQPQNREGPRTRDLRVVSGTRRRGDRMRRRDFIAAVGGGVAWPYAARAQQPAMPVIGFLSGTTSAPFAHLVAAYRQGLRERGYVEDRNLAIEFRWAEGQYDRLPEMAADLVRRRVTAITATGGDPAAFAAKAATTIIPIVFTAGTDPVKSGLVTSLNRPGGNATGVYILTAMMEGKRLGLLRELVPTVTRIAVLLNPTYTATDAQLKEVEETVRPSGYRLRCFTPAPS